MERLTHTRRRARARRFARLRPAEAGEGTTLEALCPSPRRATASDRARCARRGSVETSLSTEVWCTSAAARRRSAVSRRGRAPRSPWPANSDSRSVEQTLVASPTAVAASDASPTIVRGRSVMRTALKARIDDDEPREPAAHVGRQAIRGA